MRVSVILFCLMFIGVNNLVEAKGNVKAGEEKSQVCQSCHGADGNGILPSYPRLAGQYADYMVRALKDYKSGKRKNAVMPAFASQLSEQDMEDISAFYASKEGLIDLKIK